MKKARNVQQGDLVGRRGEKWIRSGRWMRHRCLLVGVYCAGYQMVILTDHGTQTIEVPEGVVIQGPAVIGMASQ